MTVATVAAQPTPLRPCPRGVGGDAASGASIGEAGRSCVSWMTVRPRSRALVRIPVSPRKASSMPRPATRRRALAAALACAAMLSACTGNADDGPMLPHPPPPPSWPRRPRQSAAQSAVSAAVDSLHRRLGRWCRCPGEGLHRAGPRVGQRLGQDAAGSHRGREGRRRAVEPRASRCSRSRAPATRPPRSSPRRR